MRAFLISALPACLIACAHAQSETALTEPQSIPPAEFTLTHELVADVSADRIKSDIESLVGFGTRHTLSDTISDTRGIGAARRWIEAEFKTISEGCKVPLEVVLVSDMISGEPRIPEPVQVVNVVAIQRGTLDPDRMVMMAGDIDSRVSDVMNYTDDSPGANDNASGMAGVLEAARVLCHEHGDPEPSLLLACQLTSFSQTPQFHRPDKTQVAQLL